MIQVLPKQYVYPAVFTYEPGQEIAVVFPDLGCATSGVDEEDALFSAKELLGGRLALLEEDGEEIPAPSLLSDISLEKNEKTVLIEVDMPPRRSAETVPSVNPAVTLPVWLNTAALERHTG